MRSAALAAAIGVGADAEGGPVGAHPGETGLGPAGLDLPELRLAFDVHAEVVGAVGVQAACHPDLVRLDEGGHVHVVVRLELVAWLRTARLVDAEVVRIERAGPATDGQDVVAGFERQAGQRGDIRSIVTGELARQRPQGCAPGSSRARAKTTGWAGLDDQLGVEHDRPERGIHRELVGVEVADARQPARDELARAGGAALGRRVVGLRVGSGLDAPGRTQDVGGGTVEEARESGWCGAGTEPKVRDARGAVGVLVDVSDDAAI